MDPDLMVGLDDFRGLFQPEWFYDSTINCTHDVEPETCVQSSCMACVSRFRPTVCCSCWIFRFGSCGLMWLQTALWYGF